MTDDDLRRQGMADAVLRIVAAKRFLAPLVSSREVCRALGLSQADLRGALVRLRAEHGSGERRWEVYRGGNRRPRKHSGRFTDVDERVYAAVQALGSARPAEIAAWLEEHGVGTPYATVNTSLRKQFNVGRLANPEHGVYRVA